MDVCDVFGLLPSPDLHVPVLDVEPDLKLQVLNHRGENLHPVVLQRGEPVGVELSDLCRAYLLNILDHIEGAYEKISPFFASIQKAHEEVQDPRQERSRMKFSYAAQVLKLVVFP